MLFQPGLQQLNGRLAFGQPQRQLLLALVGLRDLLLQTLQRLQGRLALGYQLAVFQIQCLPVLLPLELFVASLFLLLTQAGQTLLQLIAIGFAEAHGLFCLFVLQLQFGQLFLFQLLLLLQFGLLLHALLQALLQLFVTGLLGSQPAVQTGQFAALTLFLLPQYAAVLLQTAALSAAVLQAFFQLLQAVLLFVLFSCELFKQLPPLQHALLLMAAALQAEKTLAEPATVLCNNALLWLQLR